MPSRASVQIGTGAPELTLTSRLFEALANDRRRRIVSLLDERPGGIAEVELATQVASAEAGVPLYGVTAEQFERVYSSLRHHHLPKLDAVGLVERDDDCVALTAADASRKQLVDAVLDVEAVHPETGTALDLLASERRWLVIERLRAQGTTTVSDVVTLISDARDGDLRRARVSLVHTHLPKLADAGVIDYERDGDPVDDRRITYEGPTAVASLLDRLDDDRNFQA